MEYSSEYWDKFPYALMGALVQIPTGTQKHK